MVIIFAIMRFLQLLILVCLLTGVKTAAQDTIAHKFSFYGGYHRGFLIAHRPLVTPLQQNKINGFESAVTSQTTGSKPWHHIYGFPEIGLSIALWDLGNPEMLGNSIAVIPYLDFPMTQGRKASLDLKVGWGAGYIQKGFDADNNYKNVAVGSHLNFALILQPHLKLNLSERISFTGGISLTHYSNGSVATPNLGLNIASLTGGLSWRFREPASIQMKQLPVFKKNNRYTVFLALSSKQIYPADGPSYLAGTISLNRSWQLTHKSAFGTGADLFYDHSIYRKMEDQNLKLNSSAEAFRGGVHGSYEMVISDLSVFICMGGYLYSKINDGLFYHRVGLRYQLNKKLFATANIKAHWGKADYIEWGIGTRFRQKYKN
jgi:hypothetical protein